ncbi:MAG: SoxR reducing system RseC family protein [Alistipes sp.]|nr:SoxR reducing system RseC family protein [Alistipes sp.]
MAEVKHTGEIVRKQGNTVYVKMTVNSACSECHARGVCGVDESKEKIVEVECASAEEYNIGEKVEVALQSGSMGAKSVVLAYVVPFFLLTVALVLAIVVGASEGMAVVISLVCVAAYYLVLYFMQDRIKNNIKFKIIK